MIKQIEIKKLKKDFNTYFNLCKKVEQIQFNEVEKLYNYCLVKNKFLKCFYRKMTFKKFVKEKFFASNLDETNKRLIIYSSDQFSFLDMSIRELLNSKVRNWKKTLPLLNNAIKITSLSIYETNIERLNLLMSVFKFCDEYYIPTEQDIQLFDDMEYLKNKMKNLK